MKKYIFFTDADFPVFLAEMAMKGGYGGLIFLHDRSSGGLYIAEVSERQAAKAGLELYSDARALGSLIKKGHDYSDQLSKLMARYPAGGFKNMTAADFKRILSKYYAIMIPFLEIYSFTEGIYSSGIDKTIRNFVFRKTNSEKEVVHAFGLLLNPAEKNKIIRERERFLRETTAPDIIINLCRSVREMGKAKFVLRSTINKVYGFHTSLLNEIAKRNYFSATQLQACCLAEIIDILDGKKIDTGEINKRVKCFAAFMHNGKPIFYTGRVAQTIIERVRFTISENITEFRGDPASAGCATGHVKIVPVMMAKGGPAATRLKIKEMKKGDILVANTTGPEMIVACRKAGAIIANEGGINSHAAIVSRELEIPGIVNAKIATKVLKDGDLVEVDADKGIVRIMESARIKRV